MTVKNMVFSILFGVALTAGAIAYFLFAATDETDKPAKIIIGIFGLVGVYAIFGTLFYIVKLILLREGLDGIGTYLDHEEKKHNNRKVHYSYWVMKYSYTDEKGKYHEKKHYLQSEAEAFDFQQKRKFPIKYRGWLVKIVD